MNKHELKAWAKSKKKSYWVYLSLLTFFIIVAIVCAIIGMYASGYSLVTWFAKFYPILIIVAVLIVIVILFFKLFIKRK